MLDRFSQNLDLEQYLSYTCITITRLFIYTENFTTKKGNFLGKTKSDIFHIPAQNIDCGYTLEPPR